MKIFGFGAPKPEQPTLEEKLSQAIAETANSPAPEAEKGPKTAPEIVSEPELEPENAAIPEIEPENQGESTTLETAPEPPRALFPGSFLGGEYEIKEAISRGPVNFYRADTDDYGAHDFKLIAQRRAPQNLVETAVDAPFFPPATRFVEDEHEYAAWDFQTLTALEDWSAKPNDETYLSVMSEVARGFVALENAGLQPDLPVASLFFDGAGELKCFGFFDAKNEEAGLMPSSNLSIEEAAERLEEGVSPALPGNMTAVQQLSALSSRFAKTNLAARATLRLDDEFGALPFSEEVKTFARALSNSEFANASEVVAALENFAPLAKTEAALLSDVGMERELNEDCGLIWKSSRAGHARNSEIEVLAVADGMGGHEGGEVASDVTLGALETAIIGRQTLDFADNSVVLAALNEILVEVNAAVVALTENPPYASMRAKPGATLVCALRIGPRVFIGNVGDSRAYRWNEKSGLQRLTKDHSYVQDLLDSGSISEEEAWGHPDGSVITSHIGMMRGLKKDVFLRILSAGDRLVLVSDGVVDTLRDAQIEAIIAGNDDVSGLCAALVNAANGAGGSDNITVTALICSGGKP